MSLDRLRALLRRAGWRPWHYALLVLIHAHVVASKALAAGNDWSIVFYPWADALRFSVLRYGQFPWWNPWSMAGQPLMADPQIAVLMPDSLVLLALGAVRGYKALLVLYAIAGYEGSRRLCRRLFGDTSFVEAVSVIPVILPVLFLHFQEGHIVFLPFYLFPWLLYTGLSFQQSPRRAVAFGVVIGLHFLGYVHYVFIISFTILAVMLVPVVVRSIGSADFWKKVALALSTALGIGLTRIGLTLEIIVSFPRHETEHYPVYASLAQVIQTLVEPFQTRDLRIPVADLGWWELGAYVGIPALLLAYEGLRRGRRRLWPIHVAAALCLAFAWNNRDPIFPNYWLHFAPMYENMVVITRWRMYACFFLLLGAVQGLVVLRGSGKGRLAVLLAALVVLDLGVNAYWAFRGTFTEKAEPIVRGTDPPPTVQSSRWETWRDERANRVALDAECSLMGWEYHSTHRRHTGTPGYAGDYTGTKPVEVERWTPNKVVLRGSPGDTLSLNINPSSYWLVNGVRPFPHYRPFEPELPFQITVPPSGRVELVARPPHLTILLLGQALFALAALVLYRRLSRA